MLILGLDPGSRKTGYGLVEARGSRLKIIEQGCLAPPGNLDVPQRLGFLADALAELFGRQQPGRVAVESTFHGPSTRSLIVLAQARGALLAEAARRGLEVCEYSPAEIKSAITGSGRAPKEQVARMVGILLGADSRGWTVDASDALAVAICCARRYRMDGLTTAGRLRR